MKNRKNSYRPVYAQLGILLLMSCALSFLQACKKENADYTYDYRRNQQEQKASSVRLVNLSENAQLIANGDTLTNFFLPPQRIGYIPPEETTPPATKYFPSNGRLGQLWNVPQDLFDRDGVIRFKTVWLALPTSNVASRDIEFTAKEENNNPKDYYLLVNHEGRVQNPDAVVEVPRNVTAPAKPDHFKIRIINFSKKLLLSSSMEDVTGPITLSFADGTPISDATKNIAENSWSSYVEVPYGTYQFKVLTADGRQIPATGQSYYNYINRFNSSMETSYGSSMSYTSSGLTYAPIETFQPGGVYSIVVHPSSFTWSTGLDDITELQNGFRIIADISAPANRTFSQIQVANTLIGQDAVLSVKGQSTAATAYGLASDYRRVVAGKQTIAVHNTSGQLLASQEVELLSGQNYTVWLYAGTDKKPMLLLAANNLAGSSYTGQASNGNNAEIDRINGQFFFNFRFLNFCPQIPYATFTDGSGAPFVGNNALGQGVNVSFASMNIVQPYASLTYGMSDGYGAFYQFMAYNSLPTRIPGDWLKQIVPLSSEALVANKSLYSAVGRKIPLHEPGVYSIALIGELNAQHPSDRVKFMLVKHSK